MQILNCLIGVPKGLDYIFKSLRPLMEIAIILICLITFTYIITYT